QATVLEAQWRAAERARNGVVANVVLLKQRLRQHCVQVKRSRRQQIGLPGVRADRTAGELREWNGFARYGESAAARKVRLRDIDNSLPNQTLEAPDSGFLFAGGNADWSRLRDRSIGSIVFRVTRLFDPERVERLHRSHHRDGFF